MDATLTEMRKCYTEFVTAFTPLRQLLTEAEEVIADYENHADPSSVDAIDEFITRMGETSEKLKTLLGLNRPNYGNGQPSCPEEWTRPAKKLSDLCFYKRKWVEATRKNIEAERLAKIEAEKQAIEAERRRIAQQKADKEAYERETLEWKKRLGLTA